MDSLTFLGLLLAVIAIFGGQLLEGGSIESLLNMPALLIVLGGSLAAVLIQTHPKALRRSLSMFHWVFFSPTLPMSKGIDLIVSWSHTARKQGLLGLENEIDKVSDRFVKKGLILLIDGGLPDKIRETLLLDLEVNERNTLSAVKFYESLGGYTPTLGIVGAVLGLIQVMGNLSEPSMLGNGIATAFVATIYGVGFANLFFLPIAQKLKSIVHLQSLYLEMMIEGLVLVAEGENPKVIENKLLGFIPD